MPRATGSGCINHPGVEATARCKQCGKPVCNACHVVGPTGVFCSESCKEKHMAFIQRAQALEQRRKAGPGQFSLKVKKFITKAVVVVILLFAAGFLLVYYNKYIPYVSELIDRVRAFINI